MLFCSILFLCFYYMFDFSFFVQFYLFFRYIIFPRSQTWMQESVSESTESHHAPASRMQI